MKKKTLISFELTIGVRPLVIMRCLGNQDMVYDMSKAINKGELSKADNSFDILSRLLSFANIEISYYNALDDLYDEMITMDDVTLAKSLVGIADMVSIETIEKFLDSENYKAPNYLSDVFDVNMERNNEGSREQTFIKKDYRDLVVLTLKIKMIVLILARYIYIHNINVNASDSIKVYRLINGIKSISSLPAYEKISSFIAKNIGGDDYVTDLDISRIINKNITKIKFNDFIATSIMMFLGLVGSSDNDTPTTSMVSDLSRLCKNKNSISKNVMVNNPEISVDEDDGNGAVTDTYLSVSEIPIGYVEEIPHFYRIHNKAKDMSKILKQNKLPIDKKYLDEILPFRDLLKTKKLDRVQKSIICWLGFDVIESDYLKYFEPDIQVNFRMVSYAILKTAGINNIANILVSTIYEDGLYVSKPNTQKADPELEKALDDIYKLTISKKARSKTYGLSILDTIPEAEDGNLKELIIKPVIKRLSNIRWIAYHLPSDSSIITINNAREEVIKTMLLAYSVL